MFFYFTLVSTRYFCWIMNSGWMDFFSSTLKISFQSCLPFIYFNEKLDVTHVISPHVMCFHLFWLEFKVWALFSLTDIWLWISTYGSAWIAALESMIFHWMELWNFPYVRFTSRIACLLGISLVLPVSNGW